MPDEPKSEDLYAQVLQTTLSEISSSRQTSDTDADKTDQDPPPALNCCVICLETISEPCVALPCTHAYFDLLCLLSWLENRASCPLCKASVTKVKYNDAKTGKENTYAVESPPTAQPGAQAERHGLSFGRYGADDSRRRRSPESFRGADGLLSRPASDIERRRHIYRHQLYSLHVGSNRVSRYRLPPKPDEFVNNPHLISRARLWIRRELQVFAFLSDASEGGNGGTQHVGVNQQDRTEARRRDNAEFLLEYIVAILKTVDIQDSVGQAEDMLSGFLGRDNVRLFLHELRNWLRSPCQSLAAWDRDVQYREARISPRPVTDDAEGQEEGRPGRSWCDEQGDHWRPLPSNRKRKHPPDGLDINNRGRSPAFRRDRNCGTSIDVP